MFLYDERKISHNKISVITDENYFESSFPVNIQCVMALDWLSIRFYFKITM